MFKIIAVFFSAICIALVSMFYSIVGMTSLFSGAYWSVVAMMSALEFGKFVSAAWLHGNWRSQAVSRLHKIYLILAIGALMLITATGIYGYLSKAYLDEQVPSGTASLQIALKEQRIATDKEDINRLNDRQKQLDAAVNSLVDQKMVIRSVSIRTQQKKERDQLATDLTTKQNDIERLQTELLPFRTITQDVDTKLGPIKYVGDLFGMTNPDVAVRMVILTLMFAFDPLAVVLVLSGTISVREHFSKKFKPTFATPEIIRQPYVAPVTPQVARSSDLSDKQQILRILQENPDSIEDIIDTVIEWNDKRKPAMH